MMTKALTTPVDTVVLLPVVQFKESNSLVVDVSKLGPEGATVAAPSYQAMSVDDKLTLTVKIFLLGDEVDRIIRTKTLVAEDIDQPISWTVPKDALAVWYDGSMEVSYSITYATPTISTESNVQTLAIIDSSVGGIPPSTSLLSPPEVKGLVGDTLDPESHPGGITLLVPMYPGIEVDHTVLLYATGDTRLIKSLRVDQTNIDSEILQLAVGYSWLVANKGSEVSFMYQYASVGSAGTSTPLLVKLREPRNLPLAIIKDVIREGEDDENKGYLPARLTTNGITIDIPPEAIIGDGVATMVFDGFKPGGHYIADPSLGNPRRFLIPKLYVPANLGKRLLVYYQVTPPGEEPYTSTRFDLQIRNIEDGWPTPQIKSPAAPGNVLSLKSVTDVVTFSLGSFTFMAAGQRVRISATGVLAAGGEETFNLREGAAEVISEAEYYAGVIYATLPRTYLAKLKLNEQFDVKAEVSFDSGFSYKKMPTISPKLVE